MLDLAVLYCPEPLHHESSPKPSIAHPIACSAVIGLIAYHDHEAGTIHKGYPYMEPEDVDEDIDASAADSPTLVNGALSAGQVLK